MQLLDWCCHFNHRKFWRLPRTLNPFDVLARISKVLKCTVQSAGAQLRSSIALSYEVDMHDTKERLSQLWLFALLNYLYADVLALFDIVGSQDPAPHLPQWALLGSAVLMEIPIAMILASRLLPLRANRLANIIAGAIETLAVISMQFVYPLASGAWHEHMFASYIFFGTIETVCTSIIIWKAWTWSGVEAAVSSERIVRQREAGILSS